MDSSYLRLDDFREMKIEQNGKIVVVRPLNCMVVPLFCPICKFPLKTSDDSSSFRTFECCAKCTFKFVAPNKEKWESGWRPDNEELVEYIQSRELLEKPLLILK